MRPGAAAPEGVASPVHAHQPWAPSVVFFPGAIVLDTESSEELVTDGNASLAGFVPGDAPPQTRGVQQGRLAEPALPSGDHTGQEEVVIPPLVPGRPPVEDLAP